MAWGCEAAHSSKLLKISRIPSLGMTHSAFFLNQRGARLACGSESNARKKTRNFLHTLITLALAEILQQFLKAIMTIGPPRMHQVQVLVKPQAGRDNDKPSGMSRAYSMTVPTPNDRLERKSGAGVSCAAWSVFHTLKRPKRRCSVMRWVSCGV